MMENNTKFFQNEKKFVVGQAYETLDVKTPTWGTYECNYEICDEIGTIIPNSEKFLGYYVSSQHFGYGDGRTRCDYFTDKDGKPVSNYLKYEGTTRYRKVKSDIEK